MSRTYNIVKIEGSFVYGSPVIAFSEFLSYFKARYRANRGLGEYPELDSVVSNASYSCQAAIWLDEEGREHRTFAKWSCYGRSLYLKSPGGSHLGTWDLSQD